MSLVVSVGSQKGGTGKSTIAQGFAVEAVRNGRLAILADMDIGQQTSFRWGERRKALGIKPEIDVRLLRAVAGIAALGRLCDLLVIDTPGRTDANTVKLAELSDLLLICSGTNVIELEPAVMLMHELRAAGVAESHIVVGLNKVIDDRHEHDARAYLEKAGMQVLPVALKYHPSTHDIANQGRAVTEASHKSVVGPAQEFFTEVVTALHQAREKTLEQQREHESPTKDIERERER